MLNFIKNIFIKLGFIKFDPEPEETAREVVYEEFTQPKLNKIEKEPVLAQKDGHLVMVVDAQFNNVPSWVEWDGERSVVTITHMNGDIDEAPLEVKDEYITSLNENRKILLVSNDNEEKIMHYVQFLSRV